MTTFIPYGIVGNDSFLRGYSIYYTTFPHTRDKQQRYRNINSSLSYRLSWSTDFLFLNDCLKITGDDCLQGLSSDSSLVGCDTSLETNSVSRTGTDWSHNSETNISISLALFGPLS